MVGLRLRRLPAVTGRDSACAASDLYKGQDVIIDAYLTEARLQNNISAELDALDAAVDASYYPGARRERAKKAFINAVKTHHLTVKAAILAEKYASETKHTD